MKKLFTLIAIPAMALFSCSEREKSVKDYATPFNHSQILPSASDVTMRSLRFHPIDEFDSRNTFEAMDNFHVTRLEWTYLNFDAQGRCLDIDLVQRVLNSGRVFGGSGSGPHSIDQYNREERYRLGVIGLDGHPVVPQHKKNWENPPVSGCMNNPELLQKYISYVKKYIDAGAVSMQRDEPSTNGVSGNTGLGCYCEHCLKGFREYLGANLNGGELQEAGIVNLSDFNYRKYLIERGEDTSGKEIDWSDRNTIREFITASPLQKHFSAFQEKVNLEFTRVLTDSARAYAMQKGVQGFTYSCNNTSFQEWSRVYLHPFDFAISELMLQSANPGHLYMKAQEARALGKIQVFGSPKSMGMELPEDSMLNVRRRVIATAYASGGLASVPWDVYEQSSSGGLRYFGEYREYADLYGFIRANHEVLQDYCTAGAFGLNIEDDRYAGKFPVEKRIGSDSLCIFLRAKLAVDQSPVIVHIVDWSENPGPSVLSLNRSAFNISSGYSVGLRLPKPYHAGSHLAAENAAQSMRKSGEKQGGAQAAAFTPLVDYISLKSEIEGENIIIQLPPLTPWGILVVSSGEQQ